MNWPDATVSVKLTQKDIKNAPPYNPGAQLDRTQEINVHEHYGRPGYWGDEAKRDHSNSRQQDFQEPGN